MNLKYFFDQYKNLSLTIKALIWTIFVGTTMWIVMDRIQNQHIRGFFFTELSHELKKQAKADRLAFDHHIEMHNRSALLITSQQRLQSYVFSDAWLNRSTQETEIKHHYRPPKWLPPSSVMRTFFHARFASLIDVEGNVREMYHHFPEDPPETLLKPGGLMQKLSHNQAYMTDIEGFPYVLTARSIKNEAEEDVATLMLISPLDDDFLMDAAEGLVNSDVIMTLLFEGKIIASSDPDLLPPGTVAKTVEDKYLALGSSFFDQGASNLEVQFTSFIPVEKAQHFANEILSAVHQQRTIFALIMIFSFALITFIIARKIKRLTWQVATFSRESLGIDIKQRGDEVSRISMSFQQLKASILRTIKRADAISKGNYNYESQHETNDRDQLGRALSNMNNTLQNQAEALRAKQIELKAMNDELEALNQELEKRVEERTEELLEANEEITSLNEQLQSENLRMGAELDITRKLQQMVLPKHSELQKIKGLDVAGFMEPADEIGGDYYDVLQHNGRVKIGIGDVTGHGLESGVLMLMVQMAVRTLLANNVTNSEDFLNILNRAVFDNVKRMDSDKNLTLSLLDYHKGSLRLTGQHEEVLLVRKGGIIERIDTIDLGFMVGLEPNIEPFVAQFELHLEAGDGVVLYTDGITEAKNVENQRYGVDKLCQVVSQHWQKSSIEIQKAVVEDVRQFIGDEKLHDDITLLVIKQKTTIPPSTKVLN